MKTFLKSKAFKIVLTVVIIAGICFGVYELFIVPKQVANLQNPINLQDNIVTSNPINGLHIVASDGTEIQAIYLAPPNGGEISENDLKNHSEVFKITDFETLNSYTEKYIIPLWIDKDAIDLLPKNWVNEYPQRFYPIIVVGYNNALYAMRDKLGVFIIGAPKVDVSKQTLEGGFSVWMIKNQDNGDTSATLKGYDEPVTIDNILKVSNELFNECFTTLEYKNTKYSFSFSLPLTWKGYTIVEEKWEGYATTENSNVIETGPKILIRHPKWTTENSRQDIPIMIFTIEQWNKLAKEEFAVSAAPIGPMELGRNARYVFALPARYNFAFQTGWEEVEEIVQTNPLKAF